MSIVMAGFACLGRPETSASLVMPMHQGETKNQKERLANDRLT